MYMFEQLLCYSNTRNGQIWAKNSFSSAAKVKLGWRVASRFRLQAGGTTHCSHAVVITVVIH
jgi:hypothetical protein